MSLERTIRDTVIAESHDLDGRLQQLVRAGLMPANTIPILRKAIGKVQGGMTLQGAERDVMANFINSMMFIVLGDDAIFNRARAGAKTYATEAKEKTEYDYEGDMAMGQLKSIIANSQRMHDMLSDDTNLPEWVQSKITLAEDYISTASNYMQGEMSEETIEEKRGLWDNIHAKRKRIKGGSGERMRKPGSDGAPSAADLKASQTEEVQIDEISKEKATEYTKAAYNNLDRNKRKIGTHEWEKRSVDAGMRIPGRNRDGGPYKDDRTLTYSPDDIKGINKKIGKRLGGLNRAHKIIHKEEAELDEATYFVHTGINAHHVNKKIPTGKKDAMGQALMTSKVVKSFPYGDSQSKLTSKDQHAAAHAHAKKLNALRKEEVEELDELSKDTMLKYLSANKKSGARGGRDTIKRMRGADMAVRKYTARDSKYVRVPATEEVELDEATYFVHTGINAHHVNKKIPTGEKDAMGQALMTSKVVKSFPYGDTQSKRTSPDQHKAAHAHAKKLNAGMKEDIDAVKSMHESYKTKFDAALEHYNIKSPSELDEEKRKQFFNFVDQEFKKEDK